MRLALVLGLASVLSGCSGKRRSANGPVGEVSALAGPVSFRTPGQPSRPVAMGLAVTGDMTLRTGPAAWVEVQLRGGHLWRLEENQERALASLDLAHLPALAENAQPGTDDVTVSAARHAENEAAGTAATTPDVVYSKNTVYDFGEDTIEGDLERPDSPYLAARRVLDALGRTKLHACLRRHPARGSLSAVVTIEKDGRVSSLEPSGDLAGSAVAGCMMAAIRRTRFPPAPGRLRLTRQLLAP